MSAAVTTQASHAERIIVGMSGGVDSSVTALLLQRAGYDVAGMFMKNWDDDDPEGECPVERDAGDAAAVCERLGLALHPRDFAREYWDQVFERFLAEYRAGRTPNPDILCNREIKFRTFLEHALELGAERIATGHYVRRAWGDGHWQLLKGVDAGKDQSYFLYTLGQAQLVASEFPLGELTKSEVRRLAREAGLPNHDKKDSVGICFVGERHFPSFLSRYVAAEPGEMRTPEGELVGHHNGLAFYTLGQRQGLGIGGRAGRGSQPWYVVGKDTDSNTLIVAQGHDHPWLYAPALIAGELHWVAGEPPPLPLRCAAKTRYRQPDQACRVEALDDGRCRVVFDQPQRAVTPGQSVVLYAGDVCLGGGVIDAAEHSG